MRNGEYLKTYYAYDKTKNLLTKYTDTNGQDYNYEYDSDTGNLLKLSASTPNNGTFENTFRYTNGYLTNVSHNGFDYRFGYDELGRTASVSVGDETLFTKSYMIGPSIDADHTFYKTGEKEFVITDKRGNPMVSLYNDKEGVQHTVATTVYDKLGRVEYVIDNLRNIRYNYFYNVDGSIDYVEQRDPATAALISTDTYTYDGAKRLISKTYGEVGHTYSPIYETTDDGAIYPDDNVIGVSLAGKFTDKIATDGLRRTATRTLTLANDTPLISDSYTYYTVPVSDYTGYTCDYVKDLFTSVCGNTAGTLSYTYDKAGNIETVSKDGNQIARYYYDNINRLVREDNKLADKTYTWSYDVGGNITEKRVYDYSAHSAPMGEYPSVSYTYETTGWKDQLTSFNGQSIIYDAIGNPTTYKGNDLAWTYVRRLASYGNNTFEYGADGIRTKKNNITYVLDGTKILRETDGSSRNITYYYGTNGVVGFNYNGTDYYYRKNLQGDVIAIYTATGALVAEYVYDAWGKVTAIDRSAENIGSLNPFRYRSYYYDTETGLYYLNSRYYDPETGRFINADDVQYLDPETLGGINLYSYCLDNPVMGYDPYGTWDWGSFAQGAGWLVAGISAICVGVSVLTCGVATPLMVAVAVATVGTGVLTTVNGISEIGEAATGHNFVRDYVFCGNETAYGIYAHTTATLAEIGAAICGGWLIKNAPRIQAYKNINNYDYGKSAAKHMGERSYYDSTLLKKEIIKYGKMIREGRGVYTFRITGSSFNAPRRLFHQGTWEITVINSMKLIGHFLLDY